MVAAGFLSLSEWYFTICLMPYNRKENVLGASLNKIFPSFLPILLRVVKPRVMFWDENKILYNFKNFIDTLVKLHTFI